MAELETGTDAPKKVLTDPYDFSGNIDDIFAPPPVVTPPESTTKPPGVVCKDGKCEMPPGKVKDGGTEGDRPVGSGSTYYGVEAEAVRLYRGGQGSRKAGGELLVQGPDVRTPPGPGGTRDVVRPPDVRPGTDAPALVGEGKDVYEAKDVVAALKFAKDNNLKIFAHMGADWCPGCRAMKPMWDQAEKDLKGKAVFLNIDADQVASLPAEAQAIIRSFTAGTRTIPAVWTGNAVDDGAGGLKFNAQKLANPSSVRGQLDEIGRAPAVVPPRPDVRVPGQIPGQVPNPIRPVDTRDVLPPPPVPTRPRDVVAPVERPIVSEGQQLYEGGDIVAALKYAKDNNLPVFARLSAEWCGPCRGMKPMWEKAEKDLKGKAVFIHMDSDKVNNGEYPKEALDIIRPMIAGTTGIPAVWTGKVGADGQFQAQKLPNAWAATPMLDRLRRAAP